MCYLHILISTKVNNYAFDQSLLAIGPAVSN